MTVYEVRLGSQGRLVIPAELREAMAAEEGAVYSATVTEDGALLLQTREQARDRAIAELQRRWREVVPEGVSLVDELIAERRTEAAREFCE